VGAPGIKSAAADWYRQGRDGASVRAKNLADLYLAEKASPRMKHWPLLVPEGRRPGPTVRASSCGFMYLTGRGVSRNGRPITLGSGALHSPEISRGDEYLAPPQSETRFPEACARKARARELPRIVTSHQRNGLCGIAF